MTRFYTNHRILAVFLITAILSPAATRVGAQSGWYPVASGTNVNLNAIDWSPTQYGGASPGVFHVVGDSGTLLTSGDAGSLWTVVPGVPTSVDLNGVDFPYPDTGYIVGDSGTLFRTLRIDGQYSFSLPTANPASANLNCIASIPGTVTGYLAGDSGTILRTTTRGMTWVSHSTGTTRNITAIRMATVSRIFVCGDSGLILRSLSSGNWWRLWVGPLYQYTPFNDIETDGSYADTVWIVGNGGVILQSRNAAAPAPSWFAAASGVTTNLRAIRNMSGTLWAVGDSGVILKSVDGGFDWTPVESGTTEDLLDIAFADPLHGIVVGANGTILRTNTGGKYDPISCSPPSVRFGEVITGTTKGGVLTVRNGGPLPLDLTLVTSTNPLFTVDAPSAMLPAFGTLGLDVEYAPSGLAVDTGSIIIQADGGPYEILLPVSGQGVDSLVQPAWVWQNPRPQGNPLHDIRFFDAMNGLAVGDAGTVVTTTDGGTTWDHAAYAGGIDVPIRSVEVLDDGTAVAVGDDGLIMHTSDKGLSWSMRAAAGPFGDLGSVAFSGTDTGYVVGGGSGPASIHRTTDGGVTWTNQLPGFEHSDDLVTEYLLDISAPAPGFAVAVGWAGCSGGCYGGGVILRTTDAGVNWTRVPGSFPGLQAVTFIDASTGIAVGSYGSLLRTTDAGESWTPASSPTTSMGLVDVAFSGPTEGIALGAYGAILVTHDGGVSWVPPPSTGSEMWEAVEYQGPGRAFAVDGTGLIHVSTDGGVGWKEWSEPVFSGPLRTVTYKDAMNGIVIGWWGDILRTSDAGATWTALSGGTLLTYVDHYIGGAAYVQPDDITVVGRYGTIVRSEDGGLSWVEQESGTASTLLGVSFSDAETGYVVGERGTILRTTDGGDHWYSQVTSISSDFSGVEVVDATGAVIVGAADFILRTTDGGLSWHKIPTGPGTTLSDVELAGNWGLAVGGDGNVWRTTDGGSTWTPSATGSPYNLGAVSLSGPGVGTAVGGRGTIVKTTDFGSTWSRLPSGTGNSLYDVAFIDDLVGTVVGDFGLILRTTTGGFPAGTLTGSADPAVPIAFGLDQNYPNPFNPVTTIRYRLPVESRVVLRIYDMLGRVVTTLVDGVRPAGEQSTVWDARGVASGVYVYRLEATGVRSPGENFTRDIRMVLVR